MLVYSMSLKKKMFYLNIEFFLLEQASYQTIGRLGMNYWDEPDFFLRYEKENARSVSLIYGLSDSSFHKDSKEGIARSFAYIRSITQCNSISENL